MNYNQFLEKLESTAEGREYLDIVERAKSRSRKKQKGFEQHHIFPKGLGGTDEDGLVNLSTFEHIKVHYLLAVATQEDAMFRAMKIMSGSRLKRLSDLEKVTLEELKGWSEVRRKALELPCSPEGRKKISEKAYSRWKKFRETGRIEDVRKNISQKTREGMQTPEAIIKVRANLGSKWYYCAQTGETMHWHPWMAIPDSELWRPGRKPMSLETKKKLRNTQKALQRVFYHNDILRINKRFGPSDTIPEGFILGKKMEYCGNRRRYEIEQRTKHYDALGAPDSQVILQKQKLYEN